MYSHKHLDSADFFGEIYVKTNILDHLEQELKGPHWTGAVINISGVTDSYQSAEERYRLMPGVLKLMIKYRNPVMPHQDFKT